MKLTSNGIPFSLDECLAYDLPIDNLQDSLGTILDSSEEELRMQMEDDICTNYITVKDASEWRDVIEAVNIQLCEIKDTKKILKIKESLNRLEKYMNYDL